MNESISYNVPTVLDAIYPVGLSLIFATFTYPLIAKSMSMIVLGTAVLCIVITFDPSLYFYHNYSISYTK